MNEFRTLAAALINALRAPRGFQVVVFEKTWGSPLSFNVAAINAAADSAGLGSIFEVVNRDAGAATLTISAPAGGLPVAVEKLSPRDPMYTFEVGPNDCLRDSVIAILSDWAAQKPKKTKRGDKIRAALQLLPEHPEWLDNRFAKEVGMSPSTLSGSPTWRRAREAIRSQQKTVSKGIFHG